jgi:hypothetical protein
MSNKEIFSANLYLEDEEAKLAKNAQNSYNKRKLLNLDQKNFLKHAFLKHCEMIAKLEKK